MKLADMLQLPRSDGRGQNHPQPPQRGEGDTEAHPARVRPTIPSSASPAPGSAEAGRTATPATTTTGRPGGGGPVLLVPGRGQPLPQYHTAAVTPLTQPGPRALPQGTGRPSPVPQGLPQHPAGSSAAVGAEGLPPARPGPSPLTSPRSCSMAPRTPLTRLTRGEHVPPSAAHLIGGSREKKPNQRRACSR